MEENTRNFYCPSFLQKTKVQLSISRLEACCPFRVCEGQLSAERITPRDSHILSSIVSDQSLKYCENGEVKTQSIRIPLAFFEYLYLIPMLTIKDMCIGEGRMINTGVTGGRTTPTSNALTVTGGAEEVSNLDTSSARNHRRSDGRAPTQSNTEEMDQR